MITPYEWTMLKAYIDAKPGTSEQEKAANVIEEMLTDNWTQDFIIDNRHYKNEDDPG
jgi:hypothetical protein